MTAGLWECVVCGNDTRELSARREFLAAVLWSDVTLGQNRCTENFVYVNWPLTQEKISVSPTLN
jgi:hypothetical protein